MWDLGALRRVSIGKALAGALVAVAIVGGVWFATAAQAQRATDFELTMTSGGLPPEGGAADIIVAIKPGQSALAALAAEITFDSNLVEATECTALVGLGACSTTTPGQITVQTVDPNGWADTTELFTLTFTSRGLVDETALSIEVTEAYDMNGARIAGEASGSELRPRTMGDVNCSNSRDIADALLIAQYVVGNRSADTCPLPDPTSMIDPTHADVNDDGQINTVDALHIAQCSVGLLDCDT